ncbi:diacylglycerol/lipid kinase family protein [Fluviispira multicolorata]|uniref:DAGKc domain-containing protein n=1 Tax=Fluviispira multicolorata TaxID=2654512 RepID=A0A833JDS8_9BACT|nr:diacylglycerol kinase family protein [Fluviispira multicolorata]KAB8032043.1 hypothetical protein GCL57_05185 [Fluviispira multicolorata]
MQFTIFFIVNPNANSGKTKLNWVKKTLPLIQHNFEQAAWIFTEKEKEASFYAFYAKKCGYKTVVAVGGDGTVNEVVNGLLGNPLVFLEDFQHRIHGYLLLDNNIENNIPTFACLPMGTGSDFIRSLGIPIQLNKAIHILKNNKSIYCDVGVIENIDVTNSKNIRYFINIGGAGASGEVAQRVNLSHKRLGKNGTYIFAAVQTLLKNNHFPVQITYDDEAPFEIDLRVIFICNGRYCGGGMEVSPYSQLNNGFFQIIQVREMNKLKSIYLTKRLYSGNFSGLEKDFILRTAKKIKIIPLKNSLIPIECDGEQPFFAPVIFSIQAQKLNVIADLK